MIYQSDEVTEAARAHIDPKGNYSVSLPAGNYVVDLVRNGIDSAAGLPAEIVIRANQITVLDIDIDTGMR